jgi:hypothetical protein
MIVIGRSRSWNDANRRTESAGQSDGFQVGITHAPAKFGTAFEE